MAPSIKDPEAPRRALSAYMFFSQDMRETLKKEQPELSMVEGAKVIGQRWTETSEKDKAKYVKKAENDRKRDEEEMKDYKPSEEYIRKVNEAKAKDGKKKKKAQRDVNASKRPLSAYFHFLADKREEVKKANPDKANKDQVKILGEMWSKMADKLKKKYEEEAEKDRQRYEKDVKEYSRSKN